MIETEELDSPAEEQMELTDDDRAALKSLFESLMKENQVERRLEVSKAWRQRAYLSGIQHIWYDQRSYTFLTPQASGMELPRYMDVYNLYRPHWRNFVSILSQNPPGIDFVPEDLQRATDVTAASLAEKMRHRVDRMVNMRDRQQEAAGLFCTDGRTIAWTRMEDGALTVSVHGVLDSKVPIFARTREEWGYAVLSEEVDKYAMQDEYPDYADEMDETDAASDSGYERLARMNVIANNRARNTEDSKNLLTRHVVWVRPSRFRKIPVELRDKFKQMFPEGLRFIIVGGVVVEWVAESLDTCLRVQWPAPGQGANRTSLLHDLVPIQDAYNDYKNNLRDSAGYVNPATWVDGAAVDSEALPEQRSEAGAIHVITPTTGKSISDCVFQEQSAGLSPELSAACEQLKQDAEFITGDLPSMYGGDTEGQDTVGVNKLLSVQAKGQLSMAWAGLQWLFAGVYEIAVRLAASGGEESMAVAWDQGQESFNPAAILDGQFGCYPDSDSSFPETMADKRAALQSVLGQIGQAGEAGRAIVMQPDNLKLVKQYSGLADLIIPSSEARDKQLREIEQLLQEVPVPDQAQMQGYMQSAQQAMAQGQQPPPPPMTASVGIEDDDYHEDEAAKCKEWLSSRACYEEQQKGNVQGVQNVRLHLGLHKAAIAKAAQGQQTQTPMAISGAFKDLDPATKVQVLARDGYQPDPSAYDTDQAQAQQGKAADTQKTAADAQHKAVLAAKEAIAPAKQFSVPFQSPNKQGGDR